jgi:hypothetical protein
MDAYLAWSQGAALAQHNQRVTASDAQRDGEISLADSERDSAMLAGRVQLEIAVPANAKLQTNYSTNALGQVINSITKELVPVEGNPVYIRRLK